MAEITVKTSKKTDKLDDTNAVKGQKPSEEKLAQGQSGQHYVTDVSCCNCWAINIIETSTSHSMNFWCWNCGAGCRY